MVFVGYGFPKQEQIAGILRYLNSNTSYVCIGMGIKYFTGEMTRSPKILSKIGAEWIWRFIHEPKRLYKRYLIQGIPMFIKLGARELINKRK
jgi:exopolysaccharide biosynthesis WecB/TagA/CpsF family protein